MFAVLFNMAFLLTREDGGLQLQLGWTQNVMPGGGMVPAVRLRGSLDWHGFWRFTGLNLTVAYSEEGSSAAALTQLLLHQDAQRPDRLYDSEGRAYNSA